MSSPNAPMRYIILQVSPLYTTSLVNYRRVLRTPYSGQSSKPRPLHLHFPTSTTPAPEQSILMHQAAAPSSRPRVVMLVSMMILRNTYSVLRPNIRTGKAIRETALLSTAKTRELKRGRRRSGSMRFRDPTRLVAFPSLDFLSLSLAWGTVSRLLERLFYVLRKGEGFWL